jgi:hypothetical protein
MCCTEAPERSAGEGVDGIRVTDVGHRGGYLDALRRKAPGRGRRRGLFHVRPHHSHPVRA